MPRMDARIAPLRTLTLGLAASALLASLPAAAQETPAPAGAAARSTNVEIIVFRAAVRSWRRDLERGAGARSIHRRR